MPVPRTLSQKGEGDQECRGRELSRLSLSRLSSNNRKKMTIPNLRATVIETPHSRWFGQLGRLTIFLVSARSPAVQNPRWMGARSACGATFTVGLASIFTLTLLLAAGCSTSADGKATGPQAQVSVYREPSPRDGLFPMLFAVDGQPIVSLNPREEYRFAIPPGDHTFAYEMGVYSCSEPVTIPTAGTYRVRLAQGCVIELGSE